MKSKRTRKEIVKTAVIIFLAALLVLTFFSRTIVNRSLVQVNSERIYAMDLTLSVRVSGTVDADGLIDVRADEYIEGSEDGNIWEIADANVAVGDAVLEGDSLCSIIMSGDADIDAMQSELAGMKDNYNRAVLSSGLTLDELENLKAGERMSIEECIAQLDSLRASDKATEFDVEERRQKYMQFIEIGGLLDDIGALEARIAAAEELSVNTVNITAPIDGYIAEFAYAAGDSLMSEDVLIRILPQNTTYTMKGEVDKAQAAILKQGVSAKALGVWGSNVEAYVNGVMPSYTKPGVVDVIFDIRGDVVASQNLTLSVSGGEEHYEQVIPNSALHEDSEGYFVWLLETKNDSFGIKYMAKRQTVQVLAVGETRTAIVVEAPDDAYVITSASGPFYDGDRVRLADR